MNIKPVISSVTTPSDLLQRASASAGGSETAEAAAGDGYAPGVMRNAADPMKAFWGAAKEAGDAIQLHSQFPCTAVVTDGSAGWKTPLMGQGGTNCFIKSYGTGDGNVLVIPLEHWGGGNFATPVVVNRENGVIEKPDVKPFGTAMAARMKQSPDGSRTYLTGGDSLIVNVYDSSFKPAGKIDLHPQHPEFVRILHFESRQNADYVHVLSKDGTGDDNTHCLVALDPSTNAEKWTKQFDNGGYISNVFEAPDGTAYVAIDEDNPDPPARSSGSGRNQKHFLYVLKEGVEKGKMEFSNTPRDISFQPDGTMIVSVDRDGVKKIDPSRMNPSRYSEKWSIKDGRYQDFQPTADGKSLYGVDHCDGFYRSHRLAKIDARTGKVEWERKAYGENFNDFRVINDEIFLLTTSEDRKTVNMMKLNPAGEITWKDSVQLGEMDEYKEEEHNGITPDGSFVFGMVKDGNLYYLHPKKDGETESTILQGLSKNSREEIMQGFRDAVSADDDTGEAAKAQAAGIEDEGEFVVIDGMKLEKKKGE
jgi:outer membrane protein assembly factor BamB